MAFEIGIMTFGELTADPDFDSTVLLNPRVHGRIEVGLTDVVDLLTVRATGVRATPDA